MFMSSMFLQDLADISAGIRKLPVAIWLATEDMRARYTRTALGPLWNLLSTAIYVIAMAVTFGALFNQPLTVFLPYISASICCWNYISSIMNDGPTVLVRSAPIISAYPLPLTTQVLRSLADKTVLLFHFLVVYAVLAVWLKLPVDWLAVLLFPVAFFVYTIAAFGLTLGLSVLGARFRDIGPAINSVMVMAFLLTPIFWQKVTLRPDQHWIADFNPFFHLIEIGRQPLLGKFAALEHWLASVAIAFFCLIFGIATFASMRRKIYYWL
jgi:ABC-type polysaccharide/polyol phosphate export permease